MRGKYRRIAAGIQRKIFVRYAIDWEYHNAIVKAGDNKAIVIERFYLMPDHPDWPKVEPAEMEYPKPRLMEHEEARVAFARTVRSALVVRNALRREAAA